jgi:hypothetical protein
MEKRVISNEVSSFIAAKNLLESYYAKTNSRD